MTNKIFDKINTISNFEVDDSYLKDVFSYAISHAVGDLGYYWRDSAAKKIINDNTFHYIWESFPDSRMDLLGALITRTTAGEREDAALSCEFSKSFIKRVYSAIEDNDDCDDNSLKIRLAPIADKEFDYLERLHRYSLDDSKANLYGMWERAGSKASKDPEFYDYLWSKVKRAPGSVEIKLGILSSASSNNALSDSLVKKVAKSAPKRVKRAITSILSSKITDAKYSVDRINSRVKRGRSTDLEADRLIANGLQKKVDDIEAKIMLFVDCNDNEVVSNLLDCLSKENLPWLMPAASNHYYLSRRLQRMISEE